MNVQLNLNRDFEKANLYQGVADRFKKAQLNFENKKFGSISIRETLKAVKSATVRK